MQINKIQGISAVILPQASSWPRVRSLLGEVSDEGTLFGICLFYDVFTLFISAMSILCTFWFNDQIKYYI
jgi:hypothetical protein